VLREYARSENQRLTDVARNLVSNPNADIPPPPARNPLTPPC
jgi:hypothetical protein